MIIGIEGGIGSGKTLVQTWLLLKEFHDLKKPIYANYTLRNIPFTRINLEWLLAGMEMGFNFNHGHVCPSVDCDSPEEGFGNGCAIGIQEMHVLADSRASATKLNKLMSYFILQTGKEGINLYYDTQDLGQVDLRLRRRTDIAIRVEKKAGDIHKCLAIDRTSPDPKVTRFAVKGRSVWDEYYTKEVVRTA